MIFEGIKLMVVGMTTVMLFLTLMILFINLIAFLTRGETSRELDALARERLNASKKRASAAAPPDIDDDIAVIGAAVAAYEAERFAMSAK